MIGYLRGTILETLERSVLLDVSGVGYEVFTSEHIRERLIAGSEAVFYVYTHVREDVLQLYGFPSLQEKKAFLLLLSVNGIGPKSALEVMNVSLEELIQAIALGDTKFIQKIPGIGKKTAERLVIDLQDKIADLGTPIASGAASSPIGNRINERDMERQYQDVIAALLQLGYDKKQILSVLGQYVTFGTPEEEYSEEIVLKFCLRYL